MTKELPQKAEQFAKEHWKEISGGTFAGAVILLLIAYYRYLKSANGEEVEIPDLDAIEAEAHNPTQDEAGILLETGAYAVDSIPEGDVLAKKLATGLPGRAREVMEALANIRRKKTKSID